MYIGVILGSRKINWKHYNLGFRVCGGSDDSPYIPVLFRVLRVAKT